MAVFRWKINSCLSICQKQREKKPILCLAKEKKNANHKNTDERLARKSEHTARHMQAVHMGSTPWLRIK